MEDILRDENSNMERKIEQLQKQNKIMREALEEIADNHVPEMKTICPFGCDAPYVAREALNKCSDNNPT